MTIIGYNMFNTHLEWPPSSTNECTSSLLRYKGAARPGGEKGELAGTNQQRSETQNNACKMYQIDTIHCLQAALPDETPRY